MYLHYVVPTGQGSKPFCGPDALSQAEYFAGDNYPIWSMTRRHAAELGLLSPKTDCQRREVALESDVLYSLPVRR